MLELLDQLKKLPKEVLMLIIFDLMKDEVITYHEVTEAHIKYLKMLHDGATDDYKAILFSTTAWAAERQLLPPSARSETSSASSCRKNTSILPTSELMTNKNN